MPIFKGKASAESKWETIKPSERTGTKGEKEDEEEEKEREDERPQIVETSSTNNVVAGGLQTAAEIRAKFASKKSAVTARRVAEDSPEEETIYRDAEGKKIDTKQMRAEEKRRQARELEKKMKKMEWGKGLVQRQDRKNDAEELNKIASQPFARSVFISHPRLLRVYMKFDHISFLFIYLNSTIDDKELNDELKGKQRWNDPAAGFLTVINPSPALTIKKVYIYG